MKCEKTLWASRHRVEQGERFLRDGMGRPNPETLVFERGGEPWIPNTFGMAFGQILKDAGLPHIRLRDLRHPLRQWRLRLAWISKQYRRR